ncbi:MAG TPA: type II secretion system protein GspN [Polyangiaceae bacterium]
MKERLLKLAKYGGIVGYPIFYVLCLLVFSSITFPYDKLKERIIASFNANQLETNGKEELQIDELGGYWISGVRMKGVRLLSAPAQPGKPLSKIQIDEATIRYSVLGALIGNSDVDFDVYAFGGEVSGSYDVSGKDKSLRLNLDTVDIGQLDPVVQLIGVPMQGKVGGTIHMTLPDGKLSKANGSIALEIKGLAVGDGKAKLKGALALPKVDVGTFTLAAEAKDGTLKLTKMAAGGKDVELQGDGRVTLRDGGVSDSLFDGQVRFKINDVYRSKNDITKSLFGAPGSNAPALFELADPKVKQSKRADGFYAWTLRGPLGRLEFIPAGNSPASPGGLLNPLLPRVNP